MAILFFGGRNLPSCWKYLHTCNPAILFVKSLCIFKIYFSKKRVTLLCIVSHNFSVIRHDLYATQISPGESTAQLWRPNIDLQVMDNTFHCNGFTSTNIGNVWCDYSSKPNVRPQPLSRKEALSLNVDLCIPFTLSCVDALSWCFFAWSAPETLR